MISLHSQINERKSAFSSSKTHTCSHRYYTLVLLLYTHLLHITWSAYVRVWDAMSTVYNRRVIKQRNRNESRDREDTKSPDEWKGWEYLSERSGSSHLSRRALSREKRVAREKRGDRAAAAAAAALNEFMLLVLLMFFMARHELRREIADSITGSYVNDGGPPRRELVICRYTTHRQEKPHKAHGERERERERLTGKRGEPSQYSPFSLFSSPPILSLSLSRTLPRVWTLYRRLESDSWRLDFLLLLLLRPFGFFLETVGENTGVRALSSINGVSQMATLITNSWTRNRFFQLRKCCEAASIMYLYFYNRELN